MTTNIKHVFKQNRSLQLLILIYFFNGVSKHRIYTFVYTCDGINIKMKRRALSNRHKQLVKPIGFIKIVEK